MSEQELFNDGIEEARKSHAIIENILIWLTVALGFFGMYPLLNIYGVPILSIIYAGFLFVILTFTVRKHLCTHCYYYDKWCHCGWGRLAAKLGYEKGCGNKPLGAKLALLSWPVLMIVPIIGMIIILILYPISYDTIGLLAGFIAMVGVNFGMHIKDCKECKMRYVCDLSAAKKL